MAFALLALIALPLLATGIALYINGDSFADIVSGRERNEFHSDKNKNKYW